MKFPYEEFDLSGVRTYPLASRKSKANAGDFARPYAKKSGVAGLIDSLPNMLAAADFKAVVAAITAAREAGRGIIWGLGAHVIKTGLSPILIDLMDRGYVSALAINGAVVIHDFEIALAGATSEDVDEALGPGRFGMAEETGDAAQRRHQRRRGRAGWASARRWAAAPRDEARARSPERPCDGRAARDSGYRPRRQSAPTSSTCTRTHRAPRLGEGSLRDFRYFVVERGAPRRAACT